jgi:acetyl-CoA acyltransferase
MAAHRIYEGADVAIGAGCETITMMTDGTQNTTRLANTAARERFPGLYFPMGVTAEVVAERYSIAREDQDAYSLQSQQRYAAAVDKGWISEEIVPMKVRRAVIKKGEEPREEDAVVDRDECNRPDTTLEGLASLKPVFKETGSVTAGNASQLSDGASATLLMSAERAKQLGIEPLGVYRGSAVAGCGPRASRWTTSTSWSSTRPSLRSCSTASASSTSPTTGSTPAAARSRSGIRSG